MNRPSSIVPAPHTARRDDSVETQLWLEEHDWLHALQRSPQNVSPTFRFPDLISACVSLVFADSAAGARIFAYLGQELVLRDPRTPRRREYLWREQFQMLRALQMFEANRHPNPMFQLDQLTTACVALVRQSDAAAEQVLRQARRNVALRTARQRESSSTALAPDPPAQNMGPTAPRRSRGLPEVPLSGPTGPLPTARATDMPCFE